MPNVRKLRNSPRHACRYRVNLKQNICFTLNIGPGGFCVGILRVLPPGTEVEGSIDMNGTAVPFTGTVAWANAGDPRLGLRGTMGVHFVRPRTEADADAQVTEELPLSELAASPTAG